jgi:SpoVK/Ycf46/Vps4 family AAA+-type ATPase
MGIGKRVTNEPEQTRGSIELTQPTFSLSDMILPEITRASLNDFLAYRKYENLIFDQWGLSQTHEKQKQNAINLYGPSGTGKTMAAHAVAHELNQPLLMINYAELESKYVGETSKNITHLFSEAKNNNSIIFFDEADAILSRRVTNMSHATDVSVNQTRSVLLILMNQHNGLIIFTTNFIENYDPAFMRRILAHINFVLPDMLCRQQLWQKYIPRVLPHAVDICLLAKISDGLSGSEISNCVLKAALSAARQGLMKVDLAHFQTAIDEINNSKAANANTVEKSANIVKERVVSENYVREQITNYLGD